MTVTVNLERKAVEILWDADACEGDTVEIRCVNPDGGDVSTRETENDGHATITFPADYTGSTEVTVTGSDGGSDTGTISV